jgi:undecaprenyl-diphosphatase
MRVAVASRRPWAWLVALGVLALAVKLGCLRPLDLAIAQAVRSAQSAGLTATARAITFFGSSLWAAIVVAAMALWWWRATRLRALGALLLAGAAGLLLQAGLRYVVAQWRPDAAAPAAADWVMRYELAGFTSGHALRSAYLFGWWADALRRWGGAWAGPGALLCFAMVGAVGLTRVYLNRHWLTDVLGAWLVAGWALALTEPQRARE